MITLTVTDIGFVAVGLLVSGIYLTRKKNLPLPPGPNGYPLIGNVLQVPKSHAWKTFAKWGERYGGIMSIKLLRQPMIIINDPTIATEILDRRGNIYADRPTFEMASLSGWDHVLSNARYGPRFKEYRKLIGKVIGSRGSIEKFYPVEDYQANMFLKRVLEDPLAFNYATRKTTAAIVLHITYGYDIKEKGDDPLVDLADEAMLGFADIIRPGAYLVDVLPVLKYVPSWFPGANFKRIAQRYANATNDMADVPLAHVKEQLAQGKAASSYAADLLREPDISDERQADIKWSAASFYAAGSDTTVSAVTAYFLAAAKYPYVQAKAQAEMDGVVGMDRLPTFEDRSSLPYVEALCKELFRWLPIVPLGGPHRARRDDVYGGYLIPKNSLVVANVWKFLHDPAIYHDPFTFNPDRFLGSNPEPHPAEMGVFGYGRRVCPGLHLADASVWISIAKAVAGLAISRALDENGNQIDPVAEVTDGIVSRPIPFKCDVKPRSDRVMKMVEEATLLGGAY
ncbi:cytochrome P450 [Mycena crocata]|nr:cytochrome P450 [Mycena crocata]